MNILEPEKIRQLIHYFDMLEPKQRDQLFESFEKLGLRKTRQLIDAFGKDTFPPTLLHEVKMTPILLSFPGILEEEQLLQLIVSFGDLEEYETWNLLQSFSKDIVRSPITRISLLCPNGITYYLPFFPDKLGEHNTWNLLESCNSRFKIEESIKGMGVETHARTKYQRWTLAVDPISVLPRPALKWALRHVLQRR
ncbi:unnamed protein product [Darwinula stevensoni]|uniref:Uncharacterized protein n=1 Tax=Darwinula stevensoni TaxID=69355 RepID=A0A7R8X7R1_9CRUS|nr:unnamed protein product [Darwinula stevensoni]CAG0889333.1 unnamed protein product [Darwinula stevensoni]